MRIEPDIAGTQIVLLGAFNPAIFTPAWFALHGLLSENQADTVEPEIVHNQISVFQADWFHLQVTPDRFSIETTQAPNVRVRDLVMRLFGELLPHAPVTAIGINNSVHVKAGNKEEWNRIGTTLAPPPAWGPWCGKLDLDGDSGGMKSLVMSQPIPAGRPEGSAINITVEPSARVGAGQAGVFVLVNHHFAISKASLDSGRSLAELLEQYFEKCEDMSHGIFDHVMSLGQGNRE